MIAWIYEMVWSSVIYLYSRKLVGDSGKGQKVPCQKQTGGAKLEKHKSKNQKAISLLPNLNLKKRSRVNQRTMQRDNCQDVLK